MSRMILIALLLPIPQDGEVDRLIRGLGSSLQETRAKSEEGLLRMGDKALPALRKAVEEGTPELSLRAKAMAATLERLTAEQAHDAEERSKLLKASAFEKEKAKSKEPGTQWVDGARFDVSADPTAGGTVIWTNARNYLTKGPDPKADLAWDIEGVTDGAGREATIERCGVCSPRLVFAKGAPGPVKVHVKGSLLWLSPYTLKLPDPKEGDRLLLGDFTIEVAWPKLKVTSRKPLPKTVMERLGGEFTYEVRPGVQRVSGGFGGMGVGAGGGGGGRYGGKRAGWCLCEEGPQPLAKKPKEETLQEIPFIHPSTYTHRLEQIATIVCPFRKPVTETVDFTLEVAPK